MQIGYLSTNGGGKGRSRRDGETAMTSAEYKQAKDRANAEYRAAVAKLPADWSYTADGKAAYKAATARLCEENTRLYAEWIGAVASS